MHSAKSRTFHPFLSLLLLMWGAVHLSGCFGNSCAFNCKNGKCVDGDCVCEQGWIGEGCDIESPCNTFDCGHGTCDVDGYGQAICFCETGWGGQHCDVPYNVLLDGNYIANDNCSPQSVSYSVNFRPKPGSATEFEVTGLYQNTTAVVTGTVNSDFSHFSADKQPFGTTPYDIQIFSSSYVNQGGTNIRIDYALYSGAIVYRNCDGYMSK